MKTLQFGDQTKPASSHMRGGAFRGICLERNDFRDQDLRGTDFYGANFQFLDARSADFRQCNLGRADMRGAWMTGANFRNAEMSVSTLHEANLRNCDFRGARLWGADLSGADLRGADLRLADLRQVRLDGAKLEGALLSAHQVVPEEGAFVAWRYWNGVLFKFEVPRLANRCNSIGSRMGRAGLVKILGAWNEEGDRIPQGKEVSIGDQSVVIAVDSFLIAKEYSDDPRESNPSGVLFYLTREEALANE